MSEGIKMSPKYGVNPTIPVCFWCGKDKNEVALLGHIGNARKHEDIEAPTHMVIDFEPCKECENKMSLGFTVMEATHTPNNISKIEMQEGVYPTGRFVVVKTEAAHRIFGNLSPDTNKAFVDVEIFTQLFEQEG